MSSPTQRSLKLLRDEGWLVQIVEKYNQFARVRQDLFGFADLLCLKADTIMAVQTTSGSNVSARLEKIRQCQAATLWLECPTRKIVVHGWSKKGPRGKRKLWQCRKEEVK